MSATTDFDGLCGIICTTSTSSQQVRCNYEFGHEGDCSWVAKQDNHGPFIGLFSHPVDMDTQTKKRR